MSASSDSLAPSYRSPEGDFALYAGDCRKVVPRLPGTYDAIFADPPYFLSNGGFSVQAGKRVSVNKGAWDASKGAAADAAFTRQWLSVCRDKLADHGTLWVCGTFHNIFAVANEMTALGCRILNVVTWQKTNPPPNLSCRTFTHSTEFLIWARKHQRIPHHYDYPLMRRIAGNRQMTDLWRLPAIAPWEKAFGKHPTQKPLALLVRALLASTPPGARILDPFAGSATTGIAANLLGRAFDGVETEEAFLALAKARREALPAHRAAWAARLKDLACLTE